MNAADPRSAEVLAFLKTKVIERVGIPVEDLTESSVFIKLGLESIDAVLVSGEVEDEFGVELSPSAIFDHETLGGFTAEVVRLLNAQ